MQIPYARIAAAALLSAAFASGQMAPTDAQAQAQTLAQVQVQPRAGTLSPNGAQPAVPTAPGGGGFKSAGGAACLTGWTQVELKLDATHNLSRLTCQSPIIECPANPGFNVNIEVTKQIIDPDDGRFRLQYRCNYWKPAG